MNLNFNIAKRYLFGKKSTNAINYITWLSIIGIAIGTAALVLILSIFNGFKSIISEMDTSVNPDLKITIDKGKYIDVDSVTLQQIAHIQGVNDVSETIEEVALFDYKDIQKPGIIKGIDHRFRHVTKIDSAIIRGTFSTENNEVYHGVFGNVVGSNLSINLSDDFEPVRVYMPLRKKNTLLSKMGKSFKSMVLYPKGVFSVGGEEDAQYVFTSKAFVQKLLSFKSNKISAIELKIAPDGNEKKIRNALTEILGDGYVIKNRYEQDAAFLKIMNIEKWIAFLIVSLVLLIIAFNMVGSLWMMVLEKKKDISILRSMGYDSTNIRAIFMSLGIIITLIGIGIGLILAIILYIAQKQWGLIGIPDSFIVDAYPIQMKVTDLFIVLCTVLSIGTLASLLPARRAGQVSSNVRTE